jgi:hypothetical protein
VKPCIQTEGLKKERKKNQLVYSLAGLPRVCFILKMFKEKILPGRVWVQWILRPRVTIVTSLSGQTLCVPRVPSMGIDPGRVTSGDFWKCMVLFWNTSTSLRGLHKPQPHISTAIQPCYHPDISPGSQVSWHTCYCHSLGCSSFLPLKLLGLQCPGEIPAV